jgi:hypothetical protein
MEPLGEIRIIAPVLDMSLEQFISAVAAARFLELQNSPASVLPVCQSPGQDKYDSRLDLSFALPDGFRASLLEDLGFKFFDEEFLRPFCGDLLTESTSPTRQTLDSEFATLKRLARPAQAELDSRDDDLSPYHRLVLSFSHYAQDLVDFTTAILDARLGHQTNENKLLELFRKLSSLRQSG